MTNKKLIGVDLGGTTIKFAILTAEGEIQQKWSLRTNILDEGSHIVPDIIDSINHHIDLYKMSKDQFTIGDQATTDPGPQGDEGHVVTIVTGTLPAFTEGRHVGVVV